MQIHVRSQGPTRFHYFWYGKLERAWYMISCEWRRDTTIARGGGGGCHNVHVCIPITVGWVTCKMSPPNLDNLLVTSCSCAIMYQALPSCFPHCKKQRGPGPRLYQLYAEEIRQMAVSGHIQRYSLTQQYPLSYIASFPCLRPGLPQSTRTKWGHLVRSISLSTVHIRNVCALHLEVQGNQYLLSVKPYREVTQCSHSLFKYM